MLLTSLSIFAHWVFFSSARSKKPRRNKKTHHLFDKKPQSKLKLPLLIHYIYLSLSLYLYLYIYIPVCAEMEVHSPVIAKRVWNVLRITFFMMRKGLISKRKLIMDMNLMMKKGKLLRKSLGNLMHHHHHHHHHHSRSTVARGFGLQEYEFSCSNSPNPVFFHVPKRKHHFNFPCINYPQVIEEEEEDNKAVVLVPKTPEYTFNFRFDASDYLSPAAGERKSTPSVLLSPFSVRISNYSSEDECEEDDDGNNQVDDQAEDFIRRFYEQLRLQRRTQLLQYQEV